MRKSTIWSIAACASALNLAGCNISGDASTTTVVDAESAQGLEPLIGRVVTVYLLDAPESPSTTTANWPMRMEDTGGASAGIDPRRFMGLVLGDGQPLRARGVLHEVRGGWLVLRSPGDDEGKLGEVIVPAREVRAVFAEAGAEARTEAPDPEPFATTTEP
ncbi:MAG: hypothetical protein AAFP26_13005 [Planctomycetota bacterium]